MGVLFSYRDSDVFCHHSVDEHPDPDEFSMHAHEKCEIYYFLRGRGHYLIEGTAYPLHPRDLLIMRATETHKPQIDPGSAYERIAVHVSPALFSQLDPSGRLSEAFTDRPLGRFNLFSPEDFASGQWSACLDTLGTFTGGDLRLHVLSRVFTLLTELYDAHTGRLGRAADTAADDLSVRMVEYINSHLYEDISLADVSAHFFLSQSQTNRIFRRATGSAVWEYVVIKRLMAARALIQQGESAGSAGAACGFRDYSSFYRAYKARFGHSPKGDMPE